MKKLQQLLTKEKNKLQTLLEIIKLGNHSHHKNPHMANRPPSAKFAPPWLKSLVMSLTVGGGTFRLTPGRHFPISGPCWKNNMQELHPLELAWYGLIMHFCDSNHEITRSSKRKYNNIKDH